MQCSFSPVELTTFDALAQRGGAVFRWRTASESQNSGFAVERSIDGNAFQEIGFVEGAGTTTQPHSYRFNDEELPYGAERVTYRLKQIDTDGAFTYSAEVELALGAPERLTLEGNFPNPFSDKTTIRYALPEAGPVRLAVYDMQGRRAALLAQGKQAAPYRLSQ